MGLRPEQLDRLVTALVASFGTTEAIRDLVTRDGLGVDLAEFGPLEPPGLIAELVDWAAEAGLLPLLVEAAAATEPGNETIQGLRATVSGGPRAAAGAPVGAGAARVTQLDHNWRARLRGALLDQFPTGADLTILLDDALGQALGQVAGGGNLTEVVYNLTKWLMIDPVGRLRPLLEEAAEQRPHHPVLASLKDDVVRLGRSREGTALPPGHAPALLTGSGLDRAASALEGLLEPGQRPPSPVAPRPDDVAMYLEWLEQFIRAELLKTKNEHFVELSLRLADPREARRAESLSALGLNIALGEGEAADAQPVIRNLAGLLEALTRYHALLMLAPPGGGKTTVLHHLTLLLIGRYRKGRSHRLPVFVPLMRFRPEDAARPDAAAGWIRDWVAEQVGGRNVVAERFTELARAGRFVFLLDGLDQLPWRRSEKAKLQRLLRIDAGLRRYGLLRKLAGLFRLRWAVTAIIQREQDLTRQAAPEVDPRERAIEGLFDWSPSPVIASCREKDHVGVPDWQQVKILPMSREQVDEFVRRYAPEAGGLIEAQWDATATRPLVSNPFYLRMLTRAVARNRESGGGLRDAFARALGRRGQLLAYLLVEAVEHELRGATEPDRREVVFRGLGELAFDMLESNQTGSLPAEIFRVKLGEDADAILDVGRGIDLLELKEGQPTTIEFNHQLFLETLLAFHFKRLSGTGQAFERGLTLLARQGERWAETLRLLFEMVDDRDRTLLIGRFLGALRDPATWDVATRILSEVGVDGATRTLLTALLGDPTAADLTVRGAATILGRQRAAAAAPDLARLAGHRSEQVRRAAVEALAAIKVPARLEPFRGDPSPAVVRAYFRGRLRLDADPAAWISDVFAAGPPAHQEQLAWAIHDLAPELLARLSRDDALAVISALMTHALGTVKLLGFSAASRAPDHLQRAMKGLLLAGALEADDAMINLIARRLVVGHLDAADVRAIEQAASEMTAGTTTGGAGTTTSGNAVRAYWLLLEVRERAGPKAFIGTLGSAPEPVLQLFVLRLAARGDATALGVLTYLLVDPRAGDHAFAALCSMGPRGIGPLLAALNDPQRGVRKAAAERLQFCCLPPRLAQRVRAVLREEGIRTYPLRTLSHPEPRSFGPRGNQPGQDQQFQQYLILQGARPLFTLVAALALDIGGRMIGFAAPFTYWLGFQWFRVPPQIPGHLPKHAYGALAWSPIIERVAFGPPPPPPDGSFWLARGRLLRSLNHPDDARTVLIHCLAHEPSNDEARFEQALIERSEGRPEVALELLEAEDGRHLRRNARLRALHRLLTMDAAASRDDTPRPPARERLPVLMDLGLWDEALALGLQADDPAAAPADRFESLYLCYRMTGRIRHALAAALRNNAWAGRARAIDQIEIDNLRWVVRLDPLPDNLIGEFGLRYDLGHYQDALQLFLDGGVVPDASEPTPEQVALIGQLPEYTRDALADVLVRCGKVEVAKRIASINPGVLK